MVNSSPKPSYPVQLSHSYHAFKMKWSPVQLLRCPETPMTVQLCGVTDCLARRVQSCSEHGNCVPRGPCSCRPLTNPAVMVDNCLQLIFLADMVIAFRLAFTEDEILVTDGRRIALRYLRCAPAAPATGFSRADPHWSTLPGQLCCWSAAHLLCAVWAENNILLWRGSALLRAQQHGTASSSWLLHGEVLYTRGS